MIQSTSHSSNPEINDCVNVQIPQIDRPRKISVPNFIGVIVNIKESSMGHILYDVGTKYGCIRPLLSRNKFEICRQKKLIDPKTVDRNRTISIRDIAIREAKLGNNKESLSIFCRCATNFCKSKRCLCKRNGIFCTERCQHGRDPQTGRINKEIATNFVCENI